jgi:hypothetical protein
MTSPDLSDLITLAEQHGGKVIAAGDTEQLQAVQNGGGMSLLASRLGYVRLAEPVRFRAAWERAASLRLRDGDATVAAEYDQHARITGGDPEQIAEAAAADYTALAAGGTDALLIAADHALRRELSRRVRENLIRLGLVDDTQTVPIADGQAAGRGDLIMCTRNNHRIEAGEPGRTLANGDLLRIEAITAQGLLVRRALDADRRTELRRWTDRQFLFIDFADSELGYAVTAHVAQGRTVRAGLAVLNGSENRQHAYVALTRGTHDNTAYVFTTPVKLADPAPCTRPAPELARYDRLATHAAGGDRDDPGSASPVSVLTEIIGRDGAEQSASQARWQALSDADHLAVLHAMWTAETAPARERRYRALLQFALPPGTGQQDSHTQQWLYRTLRTAELAGLDPGEVLARAVAERDLTGARDIPAVIDARIRRHGDLVPLPASPWSAQIPQTDDPERWRFFAQLAAMMDDRRRRIGEHAAATSPPWAVAALGLVPDDPAARLAWQQMAAAIGAYRELSGHEAPDDPIGPEPTANIPDLRAAWHEARAALAPDDARDIRAMTDGQLLNLRAARPAGDNPALRLTGDNLRRTRTAAREASLAALRAHAEAAAAHRRGEHAEASRQESLAVSYQAMRDAHHTREAVLDMALRDQRRKEHEKRRQLALAEAADAELRRRHPGQPWPPIHTAEPVREPDRVQGRDREMIGIQQRSGQGSESQPSDAAIDLAEASRLLGELTARRDAADRQSPTVPTATPRLDQAGPAVPLGPARRRAAILQPPTLEIPPSPWILQRGADRDLEPEAGG